MILINSAQYVVSDLQAEFGKIPAAFLPIGNKRLYEAQVEILASRFPGEVIWLSLPEEFSVPKHDFRLIETLNLRIIRNPNQLPLYKSVMQSLEVCEVDDETLRILHGDTLIFDLPRNEDLISVAVPSSQQNWFGEHEGEELVWSGFFAFSNSLLLKEILATEIGFEQSVLEYDKSIELSRVLSSNWLDLGHVNTYYSARASNLVNRKFNATTYQDGMLKKTGQAFKIQAEIEWYRNVPSQLRIFSPQLLYAAEAENQDCYVMEYLPVPTLSEIYVYGVSSSYFWSSIFQLLSDYFKLCRELDFFVAKEIEIYSKNLNMADDFKKHVLERIRLFEENSDYFNRDKDVVVNGSIPCSTSFIVNECLGHLSNYPFNIGLTHGDLCLGNILYESRNNRIRLIDPRGLDFSGTETVFGDLRYDLGKLSHSFIGFYDFIIAGRYELKDVSNSLYLSYFFEVSVEDSILDVSNQFFDFFIDGRDYGRSCLAYMVLLFITMAPLHLEDPRRQKAFLANGVNLFNNYLRGVK